MAETKFIRVHKEVDYTILDNTFIRDETLSWKAKGVMTYLLSLPDDWCIYLSELQKHASDGRDSLRTAINELMEHGYLLRTQERGEDGKFNTIQYEIVEKPLTENPKADNPLAENPKLLNTNNTKYLNKLNTNLNLIADEKQGDTETTMKTKTREPFKTTRESILNICVKYNLTGMSDTPEQMTDWFCRVALFDDGTVIYKGVKIRNYISLVSLLKTISENGKLFKLNKRSTTYVNNKRPAVANEVTEEDFNF